MLVFYLSGSSLRFANWELIYTLEIIWISLYIYTNARLNHTNNNLSQFCLAHLSIMCTLILPSLYSSSNHFEFIPLFFSYTIPLLWQYHTFTELHIFKFVFNKMLFHHQSILYLLYKSAFFLKSIHILSSPSLSLVFWTKTSLSLITNHEMVWIITRPKMLKYQKSNK